MAGALRKTMIYLGLADGEEQYESDHAELPERTVEPEPERRERDERDVRELREERRAERGERPERSERPESAPVVLKPVPEEYRAPVTPIKRAPSTREESSVLRQITTVHPRSYNDAKIIGESFRDGIPVIMNVTDMGEADAKRLVDFSAGLVFGLHGSIERVTNKVFLLSPSTIEVLGEDRKTVDQQTTVFNQS